MGNDHQCHACERKYVRTRKYRQYVKGQVINLMWRWKERECTLRINLKTIVLQSHEKMKEKTLIVMKGPGFFGCVTSTFVPVNTDSIDAFQKRVTIWINYSNTLMGQSQWPRGLRHRSTAARLLRSWVRRRKQYKISEIESVIEGLAMRNSKKIPPGAWMFFCCVLSGRGLCDGLITRPEEFYLMWRVVVCDKETSWYEEAIARTGLQSQRNK
jgi:hypothetical protein